MEQFEGGIKHALANGFKQNLASRQNYASDLLSRPPCPQIAIIQIEIGHSVGEVLDDSRVVGDTLANDTFQFAAVIWPEPIFIAVMAGTMAKKGCDVIERFHLLFPLGFGNEFPS